ncbi:hypothetical protein [Corallococcus sp. EGB]|uniref:hypothetical protein n=1 Tax=Corallococcus sp. EGB TaxID=1521117 RepID=UPI001CC1957E|nr:hypothetical protein [Corallococcus sp. EGB]
MAFKSAEASTPSGNPRFVLTIEIDGQVRLLAWNYTGQKLAGFNVGNVPPRWLLRQVAGKKTLTVLPSGSNCAFDLCPQEPLANGPCSGE